MRIYKYSGLGIRQFNRSTLHFSNGILPLSPCEKNHKDNLQMSDLYIRITGKSQKQ